jgi:ribonucleotide monophosphatase NagD (HAD superfamily)
MLTRDYARDNGHPPVAHKVICVDFDSTIIPWGATMFDDSNPLPGAVEAIREFKKAGYKVVIFTSRMSPTWWKSEGWTVKKAVNEQMAYVTSILDKHDIPFDAVTSEKVPAVAYIDDKAIEYTGSNWDAIKERVLAL